MLRIIIAIFISFVGVLLLGKPFLAYLKKQSIGQTMYELGPDTHMHKQGTPIMGGFLFIFFTYLCSIALHKGSFFPGIDYIFAILLFALSSLLVGFFDDRIKAYKKQNMGLSAKQKLVLQFAGAFVFSLYCFFNKNIGSSIFIPFFNTFVNLGMFYIPIVTLLIVFIVNSANIQDGMDGLLTSVSSVGMLTWGIISVLAIIVVDKSIFPASSDAYLNLAIMCFSLFAACIAFLKYNYYPAKTFMGDTGSMFLGAISVAMALVLRQAFLLLFIFITPIASSLSVIIQRVYFKLSHGKRIFKMSPVHHHFEKCGYSETQVICMYVVITALCCAIAIISMFALVL